MIMHRKSFTTQVVAPVFITSFMVLILAIHVEAAPTQDGSPGKRAVPNHSDKFSDNNLPTEHPKTLRNYEQEWLKYSLGLCPLGQVSQRNRSVCCLPVSCLPGSEVVECSKNGTKDFCRTCRDGFVQPNNVSSLDMQEATCFKKIARHNKCAIYADFNYARKPFAPHIVPTLCFCKTEKCYYPNFDLGKCKENYTPCGSNQQMNKYTGVCEPCPWYSYKDMTGCWPCTINNTLLRQGRPNDDDLTTVFTKTTSETSSATNTATRKGKIDVEIIPVPGENPESDNEKTWNSTWFIVLAVSFGIVALCCCVFFVRCCEKRLSQSSWARSRIQGLKNTFCPSETVVLHVQENEGLEVTPATTPTGPQTPVTIPETEPLIANIQNQTGNHPLFNRHGQAVNQTQNQAGNQPLLNEQEEAGNQSENEQTGVVDSNVAVRSESETSLKETYGSFVGEESERNDEPKTSQDTANRGTNFSNNIIRYSESLNNKKENDKGNSRMGKVVSSSKRKGCDKEVDYASVHGDKVKCENAKIQKRGGTGFVSSDTNTTDSMTSEKVSVKSEVPENCVETFDDYRCPTDRSENLKAERLENVESDDTDDDDRKNNRPGGSRENSDQQKVTHKKSKIDKGKGPAKKKSDKVPFKKEESPVVHHYSIHHNVFNEKVHFGPTTNVLKQPMSQFSGSFDYRSSDDGGSSSDPDSNDSGNNLNKREDTSERNKKSGKKESQRRTVPHIGNDEECRPKLVGMARDTGMNRNNPDSTKKLNNKKLSLNVNDVPRHTGVINLPIQPVRQSNDRPTATVSPQVRPVAHVPPSLNPASITAGASPVSSITGYGFLHHSGHQTDVANAGDFQSVDFNQSIEAGNQHNVHTQIGFLPSTQNNSVNPYTGNQTVFENEPQMEDLKMNLREDNSGGIERTLSGSNTDSSNQSPHQALPMTRVTGSETDIQMEEMKSTCIESGEDNSVGTAHMEDGVGTDDVCCTADQAEPFGEISQEPESVSIEVEHENDSDHLNRGGDGMSESFINLRGQPEGMSLHGQQLVGLAAIEGQEIISQADSGIVESSGSCDHDQTALKQCFDREETNLKQVYVPPVTNHSTVNSIMKPVVEETGLDDNNVEDSEEEKRRKKFENDRKENDGKKK